jgi:hypothetical protein
MSASTAEQSTGRTNRRAEIRKEALRIHESALYSSETQFAYSKTWRRVDRLVGGAAAVLAAISGIGGLAQLISAKVAGIIAILAAGVGAIAVTLDAARTKERAAVSAAGYRTLQQDVRIFLKVDLDSLDDDDARQRLQLLVDRLQTLNREALIPSDPAWKKARRALQAGAQNYEVDKSGPDDSSSV